MNARDEPEGAEGEAGSTTRSKVSRVIRDYNLTGVGDELERRWLGVDVERESLRDLADYFNRQLLRVALERAGEQPIDGEIENHYQLLTADDVTASAKTKAETRLSRYGVDIEALRGDFVSHQAIHTYLTDVRDARLASDGVTAEAAIQNRSETIQRLQNRLVAVSERSLETLRDAGHLTVGSFDAMASVTVYCDDCGTSHSLVDLLDRGGCDCQDEPI